MICFRCHAFLAKTRHLISPEMQSWLNVITWISTCLFIMCMFECCHSDESQFKAGKSLLKENIYKHELVINRYS